MKKRLIAIALTAFGAVFGLAGCATPTQTTANPDLASTSMCDYKASSVAAQAKSIAGAIPLTAPNRNLKITNATRGWVVSHVKFQDQTQPTPADITLKNRTGNDASMSALISAMLRSDGISAEVQLVPLSNDGFYGNSASMVYTVIAWPVPNHPVSLHTHYQHRQPQPLTDMGTLPW